mmetsp:Transcript_96859/g.252571  ORF Transcript_96859/g.252571 Transcript_96859/m.252571 type:complete len:628 (+) Transcript_96859:1-1884(+)
MESALLAAGLAVTMAATDYEQSETFMGQDFFEPFRWSFHTAEDPTHGTVDYLGYATAAIQGLVNATANRIYMGADHTSIIDSGAGRRRTTSEGGPRGRPSVRIMSRQSYNGGLFILRLDHMPTGCGVWPAFWMYGEDPEHIWPTWGEFDIIEGVHDANRTMTTLHTAGGDCDQAEIHKDKQFTGKWLDGLDKKADNCDVNAKGEWANQGCSQGGPVGSMGRPFNEAGGGTFAAEWDPEGGHFRTWFWPAAQGPPEDVSAHKPQPDTWGMPYSYFKLSEDQCNKDHFKDMHLVFDITFCGDFGSPTFAGGCPEVAKQMTCEEFVEKHPENFTEAYWSLRGLDVYQAIRPVNLADFPGGPLQAQPQHRQWPDVYGRFGVPVDTFGEDTFPQGQVFAPQPPAATAAPSQAPDDGAGPTPVPAAQPPAQAVPDGMAAAAANGALEASDPWAPPVAPDVYHSEAEGRARIGQQGRPVEIPVAPSEEPSLEPSVYQRPLGEGGAFAFHKFPDASTDAEDTNIIATTWAPGVRDDQHRQFVDPEYLPIAMKASIQHKHGDVKLSSSSSWNVIVVGGLVVASFSLLAGVWRSRLAGASVRNRGSLTAGIEERLNYEELYDGAVPLPCIDLADFEP